jgi:hypothetical protein
MTTFFVLLLALVFILFLTSLMRRRGVESDIVSLYRRLQPVYLPALLNLLNPEDLSFLRTSLRPSDFVKLKRQRTRALIDYVSRIASNAQVLTSIGALYRHSTLPEVAAAGQLLVSRALMTRILALRTLMCLRIELMFPLFSTNLGSTITAYETARSGLLRHPSSYASVKQ